MDSSGDRGQNTAAALIAVGILVLVLAGLTILGLEISQSGLTL